MKRIYCLACCIFGLAQSARPADEGWINLFNSNDLEGWVQRGGEAIYKVKDGVIVGSTVLNTPNSFLCTEKHYGDFILEVEFKVDPRLNSGVQVRSECLETGKIVTVGGKEIKIPAGRVHGYQVEIDMDPVRDRWWAGGIYDEARRNWLYPGSHGGDGKAFTEQGRRISRQNDWNRLRVEAKGSSITTYLNGEQRAQITDLMTPRGFIALQVHGVGNDASKKAIQVQWRNVRLKELKGASAQASSPN